MKKLILLVSFTCLLLPQLMGQSNGIQTTSIEQQYEKDQLYFKLKEGSANLVNNLIDWPNYQISSIEPLFKIDAPKLRDCYVLHFNKTDLLDELLEQIQNLPSVEFCEKVPIYKTLYTPNDLTNAQWSLSTINVTQAWNITQGDSNIVIAIVDDAIRLTHEDLQANLWYNPNEIPNNGIDDDANGYIDDVNGYDVANYDNDPSPPASASNHNFTHGTHCAGIAAGSTDNNKGMASIGFNCRFMAVKTKRDNTSGTSLQQPLQGIAYAIAAKANIISMSFGGYSASATYQLLIDHGIQQGITFVAAAGNDNTIAPVYPASYNHVISVGATKLGDQKANFSNYGPTIDLMAPGQNIYSAVAGADDAYAPYSGTSMACPVVSGIAALMLSINPELPPHVIESCLKSTCDNIDAVNSSHIGQIGAGRVNAFNALNCVPGIVANFTTEYPEVCPGSVVNFIDQSTNNPTMWNWSFSGGTPSTSSAQNPAVTFPAAGNYAVTLTAANGLDTSTYVDTVYIRLPTMSFTEDTIRIYGGHSVYIKAVFTGIPPYSFIYSDGTNNDTINNVASPYYFSVTPGANTVYTPISMSDSQCVGIVSGSTAVIVDNTTPVPCNYVNGELRISENESGFVGPLLNTSNPGFGRAIANIGDLDSDGINDLAVGCPGCDGEGSVFILFLNSDGTVRSEQKITENVGGFTGTLGGAVAFGGALDTLGDLDGDGVMDLIVGSVNDFNGVVAGAGGLWILYLNTDGTVKGHDLLNPVSGNLNIPWAPQLKLGTSVACIGDLDGDGVNDIATGTQGNLDADKNGFYIIFLNSDGTAKGYQRIARNVGGFNHPISDYSMLGASIANIGDLNGDGTTDLIAGNYLAMLHIGEAYVLFMNPDGTVNHYTVLADTSWSISLNFVLYAFFSLDVAVTPDMNGDGVQDILISAPDNYLNNKGTAYLFYMDTAGHVIDYVSYGHNQGNFQGLIQNNVFGISLAFLGDLDQNGTLEIAVGQNGHANKGAVWILDLQYCCSVQADFDVESVCLLDSIEFVNTTTSGGGVEVDYWFWDFGDGDTLSGVQYPKHLYQSPGTYQVELIAGVMNGQVCFDTITKTITVGASLAPHYPNQVDLCPMETFELTSLGNLCGQAPFSYQWNTSIGLSDSTVAEPIVTGQQSTIYYVTITDALGNTGIDSIQINILNNCCLTQADFQTDATVYCYGDSVSILNTSIMNANAVHHWTFNGAVITTSNDSIPAKLSYANSGSYTISYQLQDSCGIDSLTKDIIILPPVVVGLSPVLMVCDSSSVLIGIDPLIGYQYHWSPSNLVSDSAASKVWVSPSSAQNYTLEVTDNWGCTGNETTSVIVNANTIDTSVSNTGFTLTANASNATYQWVDCNTQSLILGATGQSFSPSNNGQYAVLISQNGCTAASACQSFVINNTSTILNKKFVNIYPTPFEESLQIDFDQPYPNITVEIIDGRGKRVRFLTYHDKQNLQLYEPELTQGIYFIRIQTDDLSETFKIIKQ